MSDTVEPGQDIEAIRARIDRDLSESSRARRESDRVAEEQGKLLTEQRKLLAEELKLRTEELKLRSEDIKLRPESRKLDRDRLLAPWLAILGVLGGPITVGERSGTSFIPDRSATFPSHPF